MENKSVANNRQDQFMDIAMTFLNASRGHGMRVYDFDNPIERLSGFALMLYMVKNKCITKAINMPDGKDAVVLTLGPSLLAGDLENWIANKIGSKGLLRIAPISNKAVDSLYEKYRKSLRTCGDPYSLLNAYDKIREAQLSDEEYVELLEIAEKYLAKNASRSAGMFTNPSSLGRLAWNMLSSKPKMVLDPFMGTASFATPLPNDIKFVGWDVEPSLVEYSQLKLALSGREFECESVDSTQKDYNGKVDAIVTFPPMGVKGSDGVDLIKYTFRLFEENTTEAGEMIIVVNHGFCFGNVYASLRKEFTEKNYLDKVCAIPGGYLYGTSIPCIVLHLKKNRSEGDSIEMFNLGEDTIDLGHGRIEIDPVINRIIDNVCYGDYRCEWIQTEDIRNHDYSWDVLCYPDRHSIGGYHHGTYMPFPTVCTRFMPELVRSANLEIDILNIRAAKSYHDKLETNPSKQGRKVIVKEPVLVVGYNASCPLIAIEASEENPAYLSDNEILYRCADNVFLRYMAHLFSDNYIDQKYFEVGSPTEINRSINTWLQGIDVCVIPLPEQQVIVEDAYRAHLKKQAEDAHMQDYIEQIKEQYTQEVRSRKHNMRPYLREMKSSNDLAQLILNRASSVEEVKEKLLPLLQKMEQNRKSLSEIVDHLSQIDKYGEPEIVVVEEILHERFVYYKTQTEAEVTARVRSFTKGYCQETGEIFRLEKPELGAFVKINPYDLRRMFDCIFDNARVHGFEGNDAGHHFMIESDYDEEEDMLVIRFTNDGKPFPEGFDINRYGLLGEKAGPHAGTGDGGHQVVSIAKHFHGYVTIESTDVNDPEPRVSVIVHLPVYDKEEWDDDTQGTDEGGTILSIYE